MRTAATFFTAAAVFVAATAVTGGAVTGSPRTLTPCPSSPNCVSSQVTGDRHEMPPIRFTGSAGDAGEKLRRAILLIQRAEIVREEPGFIAARFHSRIFGFVDEAEFLVDDENGVIHFRSGARSGWYDFGVNRERMRAIRTEFDRASAEKP